LPGVTDLPVPATQTVRARNRSEDEPAAAGMVPDYVRSLAWFLDDAIPIFGKRRIGADGFLSFIPVVGEAAGFSLSAVVVLAGVKAGCSWPTIARMMFHAFGESLVGMIPLAGPVVAFFWKSNSRNLRIIEANLENRESTTRASWKVLLVAIGMAIVGVAFVVISLIVAIYTIWNWLFR